LVRAVDGSEQLTGLLDGAGVAADTPQVSVLGDDDLFRRRDAEALLVRAAMPALDDLVARLVGAGVGVRESAPVVARLKAAFMALTGAPNAPSEGEDA
jgi:ABC-2 type transport system ATP-binding protein